jgi:hypothetical protein
MLRPSDNLDLLLVGDIESQISHQPYNQLYRLILSRKMGTNWDNRSSSAVYNTFSPFLMSSDVLLESPVVTLQDNFITSGVNVDEPVVEMGNIEGKQEKTMALQEEYSSFSSEYINSASEESESKIATQIDMNVEEIEKTDIIQADNVEQPGGIPSDHSKKGGKKKKKKQKNKLLVTSLSDFSAWLLLQKQIAKQKKFDKEISKKEKVKQSAQKSIVPSDNIASESLAKILQMQGHYLKAKNMYLKLIQKFPDQSEKYNMAIDELNSLLEKDH